MSKSWSRPARKRDRRLRERPARRKMENIGCDGPRYSITEASPVELTAAEIEERKAVAAAIRETVSLERGRGEVFDVPDTPAKPFRRVSEGERLKRHGEITGPMAAAAERYAEDYAYIHDITRGRKLERLDLIGRAKGLARAKRVGLRCDRDLCALMDAVCGQGQRIGNLARDKKHRGDLEALFSRALRKLAIYYGFMVDWDNAGRKARAA